MTVTQQPAPERVQDRLSRLAVEMHGAARVLDALWSDTLEQGELLVRVVEASHALHRAVLALEGDAVLASSVHEPPVS
jgi:hypothetical protein